MQNFSEKTQNPTLEPNGHDAASCAACVEIDPKSARKEAINDMKRVHIMDAAAKVIARDGYFNVRLEDIAEEAGFSKAAIYHYFPDKEALIIHIIIREQRATYEECVRIMERGQSFLDTLRGFAMAFYERFFGTGKFYGAQSGAGVAPSPSMMSTFFVSMTKHEELFNASIMCKKETFNLLTRVISKAKQDGVLTVPVEDQTVCAFIISFFQSLIIESMHGHGDERMNRLMSGGMISREEFNRAIDSMFIFIGPWIKEGNING